MKYLERQSPARIIAIGFLAVILTGSFLLMLPVCIKPGVRLHYVDALFTSTSAVCVTGLIAVDTADTYTALGQTVVALLIRIGDLSGRGRDSGSWKKGEFKGTPSGKGSP